MVTDKIEFWVFEDHLDYLVPLDISFTVNSFNRTSGSFNEYSYNRDHFSIKIVCLKAESRRF